MRRRLATLEGELAAVKEELATERRRAGPKHGQQQGAAEGETPPPPANKTPLNVRDFGARGDGHHLPVLQPLRSLLRWVT